MTKLTHTELFVSAGLAGLAIIGLMIGGTLGSLLVGFIFLALVIYTFVYRVVKNKRRN